MNTPATAIHQRFRAGMIPPSEFPLAVARMAACDPLPCNFALKGCFGNPRLQTPLLPGASLAQWLPVKFAGLVHFPGRKIGDLLARGHGLDEDLCVQAQII